MVIYDFCCPQAHRFEGWFDSLEDCEAQQRQAMIACPVCGSSEVERQLCAPAVHLPKTAAQAQGPNQAPPARAPLAQQAPTPAPPGQSQLRALTEAFREAIDTLCEDVGPRFADEAIAMELGESEPRPIQGKTTPEEERELTELGIPFQKVRLPRFDD